jgi:hypothetical protein
MAVPEPGHGTRAAPMPIMGKSAPVKIDVMPLKPPETAANA